MAQTSSFSTGIYSSSGMPGLSRELRSLVIQARRLTDERSLGAYRSAFRGQGIEFEEVREYVPGDEIRSIDWKVTARSGRPFVKSFREERELSVMLVCDLSRSTVSGTKGQLITGVINQAASILTLVAMHNRDRVGLLTFAEKVHKFFRPERKRASHVRVLGELLEEEKREYPPGTDFISTLVFLRNVLRKRSTLFFLSDFNPDPFEQPNFRQELAALSRKHDVTMCLVADPTLESLPDRGLWPIFDPETGHEVLFDLRSEKFRAAFESLVREKRAVLERRIRETGSDFLRLSTNDSIPVAFRTFFELRARERGR